MSTASIMSLPLVLFATCSLFNMQWNLSFNPSVFVAIKELKVAVIVIAFPIRYQYRRATRLQRTKFKSVDGMHNSFQTTGNLMMNLNFDDGLILSKDIVSC
ncbi:hypothetical protein CEXT_480351 [Caerostris extrusa]|uniref:Uncharacterized protein n=1 Tax=Caerostris extrusa TaxID=172846 RepID=A0AAV4XEI5_CAEEX|nr:hypothetical protein CEXT_480351 [Caerostris extrusa]